MLLFEGEQDHLLPSTSQILLESDLFVIAGRMIGHSFLHSGPSLYGVSEAIIHMLLHGNVDTAAITLADVADMADLRDVADLRETIGMVIKCYLGGGGLDSISAFYCRLCFEKAGNERGREAVTKCQ